MSSTEQYPHPSNNNDEIDLFELALVLWTRKKLFITATAIFTLLAILYVHTHFVRLSLEYPEGIDGVEILNKFVEFSIN